MLSKKTEVKIDEILKDFRDKIIGLPTEHNYSNGEFPVVALKQFTDYFIKKYEFYIKNSDRIT
ncbi:MAG: hypothetical protein K1X86_15845 [Ignavibacteria bacterium]|nr:hypothetical protein [Ignavibacteria bacterium]